MPLVWTQQVSSFGLSGIFDVCWSAFQQQWVAVGSQNKIATSPDGINWTQRTSPFPFGYSIISVEYSPTLNQWLIVDYSWGVATSPNGITWTKQAGYAGNTSVECLWSEHDQLWVVAHQSAAIFGAPPSGAGVSTSPNGVTWTKRDSVTGNRQPSGLAYSIASDLWCIVGDSDTVVKGLTKSSDAITWNQITTFPISQPNLNGVRYSENLGMWIVAGQSNVYRSVDNFSTWSSNIAITVLTPLTPNNSSLLRAGNVDFNNGLWFVSGSYILQSGYYAACLFTSSDGISWEFTDAGLVQPAVPTTDLGIGGSGYSPALNQYIVVGSQGFLATGIPVVPVIGIRKRFPL